MGQIVPLKEKYANFRSLIEARQDQIAKVVPKQFRAEQIIQVCVQAAQHNLKLLDCTGESIIKSVLDSAQLGLPPTGPMGLGCLVPRKNGKTGKMECQFQPMYKGLIQLGYRSNMVARITAEPVFDCDEFRVTKGLNPELHHVPAEDHPNYWDVNHLIGTYCVTKVKGGDPTFTYIPRKRLDGIRAMSPAPNGDAWRDHPIPMYIKAAVIRQMGLTPMATEVPDWVMRDDDVGVPETREFIDVPFEESESEPEKPKKKAQAEPEPETSDLDAKIRALSDQILPAQFDDIVAAMAEKHKQKADLENWSEGAKIGLIVELKKVAG